MSQKDEISYDRRTVKKWVQKAQKGEVALTDFQRSFVWSGDKTANYIKAIFSGKPVGLYLILQKADPPQFDPRTFKKLATPLNNVEELILDGQQRLTSLLQALSKQSERRFFVEVSDLAAKTLEIEEVFCEQKRNARKLDEPATAYRKNCIPMDVLRAEIDERGLTPLASWCVAVSEVVGAELARVLESKIKRFVDEHFFEREIWYCSLPASTDRTTATQIFVETNTSSVRIKEFDIQVANARGVHDEDVRNSIHQAYGRPQNNVLRTLL